MKCSLFFIFLMLSFSNFATAQGNIEYQLGFKDSVKQLQRSRKSTVYELQVVTQKLDVAELGKATFQIEVDPLMTTLPLSSFEFESAPVLFSAAKPSMKFYIKILPDSLPDRNRIIAMKFKVVENLDSGKTAKNMTQLPREMKIRIDEIDRDTLANYNYLGYVGTNFDLVDGIKSKNIFFATNMFIQGKEKKHRVSISLYGNRTFTETDTSAQRTFIHYKRLNDSTVYSYRSSAKVIRSRVFDNIGASLSPLIYLGSWLSNPENAIQIYASPYFEFIWRRGNIKTNYSDITLLDSTKEMNAVPISQQVFQPGSYEFNQFDFYYGVGLTTVHESKMISIRLFTNIALHSMYFPQGDNLNINEMNYVKAPIELSFSGRLWITEPTSGVTIQAEIFNNLKHPMPYYGVTLSKAFHIDKLASLLGPLNIK